MNVFDAYQELKHKQCDAICSEHSCKSYTLQKDGRLSDSSGDSPNMVEILDAWHLVNFRDGYRNERGN